MAATKFLALLLQGFILFSAKVHEKPDEAAWKLMEERDMEMKQEMTRLMEEMERKSQPQRSLVSMILSVILQQMPQEQSIVTWGAVLFAAIAGVIVLLFWLCWWLRKRPCERDSDCSMDEISDHSADEENDTDAEERIFDILSCHNRRKQWPMQKIISKSKVMKGLVDDLLQVMRMRLSNTILPVLQEAIGVGSTFEGWSPYEPNDVVYHLLVPLKPPKGYRFCLEPIVRRLWISPVNYRIRVDLECCCGGQNTLCFIHSTKKQLKSTKKAPKILDILCTHSYLDLEKVAVWFKDLVKKAWVSLPQSRCYKMNVLPYSETSCLLQLKSDFGTKFILEIIFGVQQGDSDIFLSSPPEADTNASSKVWRLNSLVAEKKFFSHMAKQLPQGSFHLKCLHLCTSVLEGTDISPYIIKTIVMHLLNTTPASGWHRRDCIMRLADIMRHLHCCLEQKKLNFFFHGCEEKPKDIILPPDFQTYEPPNLFEHLMQDQAAHAKALRHFEKIQNRLTNRLFQAGSNSRRASIVTQ